MAAPKLDNTSGTPIGGQLAAPQISLPKGGGAIRGIGEKFATNPVTGTGSLSVPIATSPGRSGFGPQLTLSYDTGSGNGPFGMGWSLSLPSITRRTDKGLPRYQDACNSDIFILSGAEDLVPILVQDESGQWAQPIIAPRDGYNIFPYRPRIEGLFARIERWTRQSDGDTYWRSISKGNVTTFYGETPESRIADPADPTKVFSWLISRSQDDKGNEIIYGYASENSVNIDLSHANERNRSAASARTANRYLASVKYGNAQSTLALPAQPGNPSNDTAPPWYFEVVFDYGEGYFSVAPPDSNGQVFASASLSPSRTWPARQDPFSHYRACFEVRTYRLCRRVLMFHHFPNELGTPDCLVRSTEFSYQENPVATVMTSVTESGFARQLDGSYLQASLPPLDFAYSEAKVQKQVRDVDPRSLANLPASVDGSHLRWLDLDGEGLQCVLTEQDDAWFYKRNLTPLSMSLDGGQTEPVARFDDLTEIYSLPSFAQGRATRHQFMSLTGDGQLDCAVLDRPGAGFFERTDDGWLPFTSLESAPNTDWNDPNLRMIDVDGDGFSDILITAQDSITYFPSLARVGFGAPIWLPKPTDEEAGPAINFANSEKNIFLADMSGDGLSDIVRIRNGEVCYWPNVGYGLFGAKVTMDNAPWFDAPDLFDPARIRLADIDGSGVTDIVYLAADGVRIYFNQSGNSWTGADQVMDYPPVEQLASIQALDLLGNGTACLVWTSSDPSDVGRSIRYIDMMGRDKPYLMVSTRNNLGAETRISYAPSTAFYLADRAAGQPWATRLPFPVYVVERVETFDWISRNRFVTRYSYHHGYYDGTEREFRGFGMVEQRDTEELGVLTQTGAFSDASNIDAASYVPPVLTKTWFHTGAYPMGPYVTRIYDEEYWPQNALSAAADFDIPLPDSPIPANFTGDEIREALRSLKGAMLHQEIYALDGTGAQTIPYSVSDRNFTINLLQPLGGNRHAVFLTHARETLDLHYERTTYTVSGNIFCDPRVTHGFVLEIDDFGNETKSAAIAYGRMYPDPDSLMTDADRAVQAKTLVTYTESTYTNAIAAGDAYRTPMPGEARTYELTGYTPSGAAGRFQSSDFVASGPTGPQLIYDSEIPYQAQPTTGRQRRLIEQVRTLYRADDLQGALPLFTLQSLALPFVSYKLALTADILSSVYLRPQSGQAPEQLVPDPQSVLKGAKGGYVLTDDQITLGLFPATDAPGNWWIPTGQVFYSAGSADPPATELQIARGNFFLGRRYCDIFGNNTTILFDIYDLFSVQVTDPVGNSVVAKSDYRVLQPQIITDANGNQSAVAFDALGMVVGTAVMDKAVPATQQDSITGLVADLTQAQIDAFFASPRGPMAATLLGTATSRIIYDVGRFARAPSTPEAPLPNFAVTIQRETHVQNLGPNVTSLLQVGLSYSDGFGRAIQKKAQADPGPLVPNGPVSPFRWIASGWTIWNNKGKPVRSYEPFFTATSDFEYGVAIGVSSTLFYDPIGRAVATLHPDHSWEKVTFDPWRQDSWDANDTIRITNPKTGAVITDPSADPDVGLYFLRIPSADYSPTWYEQRRSGALGAEAQEAAQKTLVHADTPATTHFDALGRAFLTLAFNRSQLGVNPPIEGHYRTTIAFDIEGNQRTIIDALRRMIMSYDYDMLGTKLHQVSVDAGQRWILNDANGKSYLGWDSRAHRLEHDYDAARRPTALWVQTGSAAAMLAEKTIYGEGQTDAAAFNLLGKPYQQYDAAGIVTNSAYDFVGNLLSSSREIFNSAAHKIADYANQIDWSVPLPATLSGETFTASSTFDALNRLVTLTAPDGSITRPTYDQAGVLVQVSVNLQGLPTATPFVTNIEYDAKGQRILIQLGNGAQTAYTYDPQTYRLTSLTTTRSSDSANLQALSYTYDPVGNITFINDAAQETVFFANQMVSADNDYVYDAIYRLIQATGREAIGLVSAPQTTWNDGSRMGQALPLPSDAQALRAYTEAYTYDDVGNFLSTIHNATNGNWTRSYAYDEPNQPPTNNRLTGTTVGGTTSTYTYDAHGNMTTMPQLPLMAWDFKDQLQATETRVDNSSPAETTYYVYDASGQRVRKIMGKASGEIAYERIYIGGFELYREYETGGALSLERQTLHVMDDKQRVAMVETLTAGDDDSPKQLLRYQFGNHLGSACLELDEEAAIISYEEYYPYGSTSYQAVDSTIKAAAKRYRFIGEERDDETGLNYHGARYYAPWLGRWVSCDPIGPADNSNLYLFVQANPTRMVDPSGTQTEVPNTGPSDAGAPTLNPNATTTAPTDNNGGTLIPGGAAPMEDAKAGKVTYETVPGQAQAEVRPLADQLKELIRDTAEAARNVVPGFVNRAVGTTNAIVKATPKAALLPSVPTFLLDQIPMVQSLNRHVDLVFDRLQLEHADSPAGNLGYGLGMLGFDAFLNVAAGSLASELTATKAAEAAASGAGPAISEEAFSSGILRNKPIYPTSGFPSDLGLEEGEAGYFGTSGPGYAVRVGNATQPSGRFFVSEHLTLDEAFEAADAVAAQGQDALRRQLALNPEWGNRIETAWVVQKPASLTITGTIGPQGSLLGGGSAIVLPTLQLNPVLGIPVSGPR